MSLSSTLLRSVCSSRCSARYYSAAVASSSKPVAAKIPVSSCKAGTVLKGLSVLKDKPDPIALADEEYPAWLWTILDSTKPTTAAVAASDRKGRKKAVEVEEVQVEQTVQETGPAQFDFVKERKKLRAANRASIKAANFLKTT